MWAGGRAGGRPDGRSSVWAGGRALIVGTLLRDGRPRADERAGKRADADEQARGEGAGVHY